MVAPAVDTTVATDHSSHAMCDQCSGPANEPIPGMRRPTQRRSAAGQSTQATAMQFRHHARGSPSLRRRLGPLDANADQTRNDPRRVGASRPARAALLSSSPVLLLSVRGRIDHR